MARYILGFHAVEELLRSRNAQGELIVARRDSRTASLVELARQQGCPVVFRSVKDLDKICGTNRHRGAAFYLAQSTTKPAVTLKKSIKEISSRHSIVLLLDGITDPHNLGAIIRSADQFSVDLIVLPKHGSVKDNQTVASVSAGASAWVRVSQETNLVRAIGVLKNEGFWLFGAHLDGESVEQIDLSGKIGLVLGSEGKGLRPLVSKECDSLVRIPSSGHVSSFNVSVAAGILLYEIRRQQGQLNGPASIGGEESQR